MDGPEPTPLADGPRLLAAMSATQRMAAAALVLTVAALLAFAAYLGGRSADDAATVVEPVGEPIYPPEKRPERVRGRDLLAQYLELRGVRVKHLPGGAYRIRNGADAREALVALLAILRLREGVAASNLAMAGVAGPGDGSAYRRRRVVIHPDGGATVENDTDLPDLRGYAPGHPGAGTEGFVFLSNVNPTLEQLEIREIRRIRRTVLAVLRRFDPTVVTTQPLRGETE